jgi:glycosyltransferase involved in cell wall biosynthesis
VRTYGLDAERVHAVHCGPGRAPRPASPAARTRVRERAGEGPLVLTVSAGHSYKNLDGLLRAGAELQRRMPVATLVQAGPLGAQEGPLRALAARLGVRAHLLGWVDDDTLEALYAEAGVVACPSLGEGFGLPLLEAFARNTPVVASVIGPFREVGSEAALYADAQDPVAFADALQRVLGDPDVGAGLAAAGRERARAFDWALTAEGTLAAYDVALAGQSATPRP